jgi:hypothetical protein
LAWAGNPDHENDRNRSISPACLAPVLAVAGIRFVSLQFGETSPPPFPLVRPLVAAGDFAGSAALMQELDLLITIDSAPAHLMGSLGRPVWILLPDPPDWRWLLGRNDSPWYPSARLFRQERRSDWSTPLERVADALRHLRQQHGAHPRTRQGAIDSG